LTGFNLNAPSELRPKMDTALIMAAAQRLAQGQVVAFPTETVYGLGADAANVQAVANIYALKGRPTTHPLIVHISSKTDVARWALNVPTYAHLLINAFWPGPLTLILPRSNNVTDVITGGQDTVGLRCPSHPHAQALLAACSTLGVYGLAAPSANRFGRISATTAAHVTEEFGHDLWVLDGGACDIGIESTIVDCSGAQPILLRPGIISRDQLSQITGIAVQERNIDSPRASGSLPAHYQPQTPAHLCKPAEGLAGLPSKHMGLFAVQKPSGFEGMFIPAPSEPNAYAHALYASLRVLDAAQLKCILIEAPPTDPQWEAVNDRLQRATAH
jgi:L-threonylcarbamoyladenylate synthase